VGAHRLDVVLQEPLGGGRDGHAPGSAALGRLGADVDEAGRPVDVVEPEAEELLAAEGGVVGQQDQRPVARRLAGEQVGDEGAPLVVAGDPGEAAAPRDGPALGEAPVGVAARDGVGRRAVEVVLEPEVEEEPDGDDALLDGGVGQPRAAGVRRPAPMQPVEVAVDVGPGRLDDALGRGGGPGAQEVLQVAGVGVDGLGRPLPQDQRLDEGPRGRVGRHRRVEVPGDLPHAPPPRGLPRR
jgi:hypothetical protein